MNISQRLTNLEQKIVATDKNPKALLIRVIGGTTNHSDRAGILYTYDYQQRLNTEYHLTTKQIEQYDNAQLDLSQLTPHNVVKY